MTARRRALIDLCRWAHWLYFRAKASPAAREAFYRNFREWFEEYD